MAASSSSSRSLPRIAAYRRAYSWRENWSYTASRKYGVPLIALNALLLSICGASSVHSIALVFAALDGLRTTKGLERVGGDLRVDDVVVGQLLRRGIEVAVRDIVVIRPHRARRREAGVHGPNTVLGERIVGVLDRFARLVRRVDDDRDDLGLLAIDRPVALDQRGDDVAQQRRIFLNQVFRCAVCIEREVRHEGRELDEDVRAGLLLQREEGVFGMEDDPIDLPGDETGETARGVLRDKLRVVDSELAQLEDFASHQPVE